MKKLLLMIGVRRVCSTSIGHTGADLQRCYSSYYEDGKLTKKFIYANNMEIIQDKVQVSIYYLDENVILVQGGMKQGLHFIFKDHLGSILSAFDEKGTKAFEATYDAWGKQDVKLNMIGLRRGYTGHEMINEFGIINMNGRLYDPELGRFFSPDPYVQFPEFSQSYNRYSYCLNNPLKYTDPSGQLSEAAVFFIASSLFHIGKGMLHAQATGGNVIKAGLVSLLSSPLTSFGIGKLYGGTGSIGKELLRAGTHGLASGLASALDGGGFGSFASGFISGGASAMATYAGMKGLSPEGLSDSQRQSLGFRAAMVGGGASLMVGGNFLKGALFGYNIAMFNYAEGFPAQKYVDKDGNEYTELQDAIVTAKESKDFLVFKKWFNLSASTFSNGNLFADSYGNSLKRYEVNSTFVSNGRSMAQSPFIKEINTTPKTLNALGSNITSKTGAATRLIGGCQIAFGFAQDSMDYYNYGYTNGYNTVRATVSFGAAWAGMEVGLCIGASIGSCFGGVGAIPGSIIGAAVYGVILGYWGGEAGSQTVDWLYGM